MNSHYLYLLVVLGCIAVPFIFSFESRLQFHKKWKAFIPANLISLAFFVLWDMWFTYEGIWGFNPKYLTGLKLGNLPIEEWLFFICIPYACVFTYEAVRYAFPKEPLRKLSILSNFAFLMVCGLLTILVSDRWYPFCTAILSILFLASIFRFANRRITGWFLIMYAIILVPFIISNGILTGVRFWEYPFLNMYPNAVDDHIVWYNNGHNLRLRLFSMPIDDLLYGFLLLFMNVSLYDTFLKRKRS